MKQSAGSLCSTSSDGEMATTASHAPTSGDHAPTAGDHAPSAAYSGAGDSVVYVAPTAEKPYTRFVDPRLDEARRGRVGTPFTRQTLLPSASEVADTLRSTNRKNIKTLLRNSHWSSTNVVRLQSFAFISKGIEDDVLDYFVRTFR